MSRAEKEFREKTAIRRTVSMLSRQIGKLERDRKTYLEQAKKAKLNGNSALYSLTRSQIKAVVGQTRRLEVMKANIEFAAGQREFLEHNRNFVKSMGFLGKSLLKTMQMTDIGETMRLLEKSFTKVNASMEGLDFMLDSNMSLFDTAAGSEIPDEEIDALIGSFAAGEENALDAKLDALEQTVPRVPVYAGAQARPAGGALEPKAEQKRPDRSGTDGRPEGGNAAAGTGGAQTGHGNARNMPDETGGKERKSEADEAGRPGGSGAAGQYDRAGGNGSGGQYDRAGGNGAAGQYDRPGGNGAAGQYNRPGGNGAGGQYDWPGGKPLNDRPSLLKGAALRPQRFADYVGQEKAVATLRDPVKKALLTGGALPHVLICGSFGQGKTTLAKIIANEMRARFIEVPGSVKPRDMIRTLKNLGENDILFIDEVHKLAPDVVETVLYPAIEDFELHLVESNSARTRNVTVRLPRFTLVGATTESGKLLKPFYSKFPLKITLEDYSERIVASIVKNSFRARGIEADDDAAYDIARRSRLIPRTANAFVEGIASKVLVRTAERMGVAGRDALKNQSPERWGMRVTLADAEEYFDMTGYDRLGLTEIEKKLMYVLMTKEGGRPIGQEQLAKTLGVSINRVDEEYEPYLLKLGLISIRPTGRVATDKAYAYFGMTPRRKKAGSGGSDDAGDDKNGTAADSGGNGENNGGGNKDNAGNGDGGQGAGTTGAAESGASESEAENGADESKESGGGSKDNAGNGDGVQGAGTAGTADSEAEDEAAESGEAGGGKKDNAGNGDGVQGAGTTGAGDKGASESEADYSADESGYEAYGETGTLEREDEEGLADDVPVLACRPVRFNAKAAARLSALLSGDGAVGMPPLDAIFPDVQKEYDSAAVNRCVLQLPNGREVYCDSKLERRFLEYMFRTGFAADAKGEALALTYASSSMEGKTYYPDFVVRLSDGRTAVIEMKNLSAIGYHLNIDKYEALSRFAAENGLLYAEIAKDYETGRYVSAAQLQAEPVDENLRAFVYERLDAAGVCTADDLQRYGYSVRGLLTLLLNDRALKNVDRTGSRPEIVPT